jgi:hypothetical protein
MPTAFSKPWEELVRLGVALSVGDTVVYKFGVFTVGTAHTASAADEPGVSAKFTGSVGTTFDDALYGGGGATLPTLVRRTNNGTGILSSTTLVDDSSQATPGLEFAVGVSEIWVFKMVLHTYCASDSAEIKMAIAVPAGSGGSWGAVGPSSAITSTYESTGGWQSRRAFGDAETLVRGVTSNAGTPSSLIVIEGLVDTSSTAGLVKLRWAQNASTASTLFILGESYLIAEKIA